MALWKPFRGSRADLDAVPKHDGYVYFCDDGALFFDYVDADGNLQRKQINDSMITKLEELESDYIKNKFDMSSGEGVASLVGNDTENNQAVSANSTALGSGTIAGSKGFRIIASSGTAGGIGTYTLENYTGEYEVGDEYSLRIESVYDRRGKITDISGNVITVDNFVADELAVLPDGETYLGDKNSFRVESKPLMGDVDIGKYSFAIGAETQALGMLSFAEGYATIAFGKYSHAEGVGTVANYSAHAEGKYTSALGQTSHVEGTLTESRGHCSHAEGEGTLSSGFRSHAEGSGLVQSGKVITPLEAKGRASHAEGNVTLASGDASHAEGSNTVASGSSAHAEGNNSQSKGYGTHAEGNKTVAEGNGAHAEGEGCKATMRAAHAEGVNSFASGSISHSEGYNTQATAETSHSEGYQTQATGARSHSEGYKSVAAGKTSHAEGSQTTAYGENSHAEGAGTQANAPKSHAEGDGTIASSASQHVQGKYNIEDTLGTYAHIVGNGSSSVPSTAHTLDWSGNAWFAGNVSNYKGTLATNNDLYWSNESFGKTIVQGTDVEKTFNTISNAFYGIVDGRSCHVANKTGSGVVSFIDVLSSAVKVSTNKIGAWLYWGGNESVSGVNIELTSSGKCDNQEIMFSPTLLPGWNYYVFDLTKSSSDTNLNGYVGYTNRQTDFNSSAINYIRIHSIKQTTNYTDNGVMFAVGQIKPIEDSITIGSTTITEEQLKKLLTLLDYTEYTGGTV